MIFAFYDKMTPTRYGFVPARSPEALPQKGARWESVIGFEFTPPAEPRSWIDAEVRQGFSFAVITFSTSSGRRGRTDRL
jgi:hypothetical protein